MNRASGCLALICVCSWAGPLAAQPAAAPVPAGACMHVAPWADHARAADSNWAHHSGPAGAPQPHDADGAHLRADPPAREIPFQSTATDSCPRGMGHDRLGDTALVPVSEPHGYLLTAAGLAVIGVIVRRRRRR